MEVISRFFTKNKSYIYIIVIIFCAIFLSIPLFSNKIDVFRDDGIQHVIRIEETKKAIKNGVSFKVYYDLYNSFGYSWDIFYGNFTTVIPATICALTRIDAIIAFKIFLGMLLLFSGLSMYFATYEMFENKDISFIAAVLYMCAPYHLNDIYIRFAAGEIAAFVFIPLVFAGLDSLIKDKKASNGFLFLTIGTSGLILSHLLSTIITAIFCIVYLIANINIIRKNIKVIKRILVSILISLCLTSFFWVPLAEHSLFEKYEVYEDGKMAESDMLNRHRVEIKNLFTSKNYFQVHEIGIIICALGLLSIYVYIRKKIDKKYLKTHILFFIFSILSLLIASKLIDWRNVPKAFLMIQFPWRFFEFSSYFLSVVGAMSFFYFMKSFKMKDALFIVVITMILSFNYKDKIRYKDEELQVPKVVGIVREENVYKTNAGCAKFEYLSDKAYKNMKYATKRKNGAIFDDEVKIIEENKINGKYKLKFLTDKKELKVELPYTYYKGYIIKLNDESIKYKENEVGFIESDLKNLKEENNIEVEYVGTIYGVFANVLSIISIFIFGIIYIFYRKKELTE